MTPSTHEYSETSKSSDILSLSLKRENISSYGGIYSNLNEDHSCTDFSDNNSDEKFKKDNMKNVTFQWDEEESDSEIVYLTGSFCNWKQFFIMPKIDDKYSITLPLPKALHKFKFRINEDYKLNKNYPIMEDGDNKCNYIDTSNTKDTNSKSRNSSKSKNKENSEDDSSEEESSISSSNSLLYEAEIEDEEERLKRLKKLKIKKKKYSQKFPKKRNLNNYAPDVPYSYNYLYNLNVISPQKFIGKKEYLETKENNILGDNCSYKKIGVLPAVEINHIHSNNLIISGDGALCSSFVRYRNKFNFVNIIKCNLIYNVFI
jgi:hypothetical protein